VSGDENVDFVSEPRSQQRAESVINDPLDSSTVNIIHQRHQHSSTTFLSCPISDSPNIHVMPLRNRFSTDFSRKASDLTLDSVEKEFHHKTFPKPPPRRNKIKWEGSLSPLSSHKSLSDVDGDVSAAIQPQNVE